MGGDQLGGAAGESSFLASGTMMFQHGNLGVFFGGNDGAGENRLIGSSGPLEDFDGAGNFDVLRHFDERQILQVRLMQGNEFLAAEPGGNGVEQVLGGFQAIWKRLQGDAQLLQSAVQVDESPVDENDSSSRVLHSRAAGNQIRFCRDIHGGGIDECIEFQLREVGKPPAFIAARGQGKAGVVVPGELLHFRKPRGDVGVIPCWCIQNGGLS